MEPEFNYLFVSDFHIALGQDPFTKVYHPREDFLYDAEFFRFLRWADKNRENNGRSWELVFVGDCFDFLPVELAWYDEYQQIYDQLSRSLAQPNAKRALEPWYDFFNLSTLPDDVKIDLLSHFVKPNLLEFTTVGSDEIRPFLKKRQQLRDADDSYEYEELAGDPQFDEDASFEDVAGVPEETQIDDSPEPENPYWEHWESKLKLDDRQADMLRGADEYANEHDLVLVPPALTQAISPPDQNEAAALRKSSFIALKSIQTAPHRLPQFRLRKNARLTDLQYRMLTEEKMSLEKLYFIYRGHQTFFYSLAWWIARGHKLVILPGNHDLEIAWPKVHQRFKDLIYYSFQTNQKKWLAESPSKNGTDPDASPQNDQKSFLERINYHGWFYYKKGVFFAQHGAQYDNLNGTINLLNPYQTREPDPDKRKLNQAFGSLGVATFVAHMEDQFPQWESEGSYSVTLTRLLKEHPWRTARLIGANVWSFARLSWYQFRDTGGFHPNLEQQLPTRAEIQEYGQRFGIDETVVQQIYCSWDPPMFSLGWFRIAALLGLNLLGIVFWVVNLVLKAINWLFHPRGGLVLAATLLLFLLFLPGAAEFLGSLTGITDGWKNSTLNQVLNIPAAGLLIGLMLRAFWSGIADIVQQKKAAKNEKFFQLVFYHDYIFEGAKGVYNIFRANKVDPAPRYYIMGHDHHPGRKRLGYSPGYDGYDFTFFNTGSWLTSFESNSIRRLRTGGVDNEFTFLKIWGQSEIDDPFVDGALDYAAELMRWNDAANRADPQITIGTRQEEAQPVRGFWSALVVAVSLLFGFLLENFWLWSFLGLALGVTLAVIGQLHRIRHKQTMPVAEDFWQEESFAPGRTDCFSDSN